MLEGWGSEGSVSTSLQSAMQYSYSPLKCFHSIRLLYLAPWREAEILRGEIKEVALDEADVYKALSYAWGFDDKLHSLRTSSGLIVEANCLIDIDLKSGKQNASNRCPSNIAIQSKREDPFVDLRNGEKPPSPFVIVSANYSDWLDRRDR